MGVGTLAKTAETNQAAIEHHCETTRPTKRYAQQCNRQGGAALTAAAWAAAVAWTAATTRPAFNATAWADATLTAA